MDGEGEGAALLALGAIETTAAVRRKLQAYEDSKWVGVHEGAEWPAERRLLMEVDAHQVVWGVSKRRRLFLFNDCVLIVYPYSDEMYQQQGMVPIDRRLQVATQVSRRFPLIPLQQCRFTPVTVAIQG